MARSPATTTRERIRYATVFTAAAFAVDIGARYLDLRAGMPQARGLLMLKWILALVPLRFLVFYVIAPAMRREARWFSGPEDPPSSWWGCLGRIAADVAWMLAVLAYPLLLRHI